MPNEDSRLDSPPMPRADLVRFVTEIDAKSRWGIKWQRNNSPPEALAKLEAAGYLRVSGRGRHRAYHHNGLSRCAQCDSAPRNLCNCEGDYAE